MVLQQGKLCCLNVVSGGCGGVFRRCPSYSANRNCRGVICGFFGSMAAVVPGYSARVGDIGSRFRGDARSFLLSSGRFMEPLIVARRLCGLGGRLFGNGGGFRGSCLVRAKSGRKCGSTIGG